MRGRTGMPSRRLQVRIHVHSMRCIELVSGCAGYLRQRASVSFDKTCLAGEEQGEDGGIACKDNGAD